MAKKSAIENLLEIVNVKDCYCKNGWVLKKERNTYELYNTRTTRNDIDHISISDVAIWVYTGARLFTFITKEQFLEFAKKEGISEMISPVLLSLEVNDE